MIQNSDKTVTDVDRAINQANLSARQDRRLVILGSILVSVSLIFPVVASLVQQTSMPSWIGVLDVILAFTVVLMMITIAAISRGRIDTLIEQVSYRVYRRLVNIPLVLIVLFFVIGDLIKWDVLLIGLAWRLWLLLYILPLHWLYGVLSAHLTRIPQAE